MNNKKQIFGILKKMATLKGIEVTAERLTLMTEVLSCFTPEQINMAVQKLIIETRFFPDVADFVRIIKAKGSTMDAEAIASKVFQAVQKFGWCNSRDAEKWLGVESWLVVQRAGGWSLICDTPQNDASIMRAQLRKIAETVIHADDIDHRAAVRSSETPQIDVGTAKTIDYMAYTPEKR